MHLMTFVHIAKPTALERWTSGVHPGITLATGRGDKSDAFYSKRVPRGAPEYVETTRVTFPSGRTADEVCGERFQP